MLFQLAHLFCTCGQADRLDELRLILTTGKSCWTINDGQHLGAAKERGHVVLYADDNMHPRTAQQQEGHLARFDLIGTYNYFGQSRRFYSY